MITVGIVEDDNEIRTALQNFLNNQTEMTCAIAANSVERMLHEIKITGIPDVILMDIGLPGMSGIDGIRIIKDSYPETEMIMLTIYNDTDKIFDSLCAGASGYLLKNTPLQDISLGISQAHSKGAPMSPQIARQVINHFNKNNKASKKISPLTEREKEIVVGLVDGLSYKLIANRMSISIETVRYHIKNIYRKLHVNSKTEVVSKSLKGEI